jgi:predicted nucleic acid-binding protein
MNGPFDTAWTDANQAYLVGEFVELRHRIAGEEAANHRRSAEFVPPPAIDALAATFDLSRFEREIVLLCAGVEMDSDLARRCAEVSGRAPHNAVTFSLAMSILSEPHWSALSPSAPLRRFHLVEMDSGHGITSAPLHIDERILHYLAGVNELDPKFGYLVRCQPEPARLAAEHASLVMEIIERGHGALPARSVLSLCGDDARGQEGIAAEIARRAGCELFVLRLEDAPSVGTELENFLQLWTREARLLPACLLLQCDSEAPTVAVRQLAERLPAPVLIASREPVHLHRSVAQYLVDKPDPAGQKRLWQSALPVDAAELNATVDELAEQFRLSAEAIASIAESLVSSKGGDRDAGDREERIATQLWNACRAVSRPALESLAQRIEPSYGWDDLVLPALQKDTLRQFAAQARHRMTIYEEWGFAEKGRRSLGLSALFSGPSGTGKTLAAEVLARELRLDLYRIDLSAVVSKYIGETEKNLKRVFDAAESGGVLLLFDEADALFGKRAEVKDSHDRYANIEVGYLLQRMESFQGLAILTTNLKSSLDKSFQRRLRFSVDFPFPDAAQREAIWTRVFPAQTPTKDLEPSRLATLNMPGGNIRNIALNAAFIAAAAGQSVEMNHILRATQFEAVKTERPLSEREIRGWV